MKNSRKHIPEKLILVLALLVVALLFKVLLFPSGRTAQDSQSAASAITLSNVSEASETESSTEETAKKSKKKKKKTSDKSSDTGSETAESSADTDGDVMTLDSVDEPYYYYKTLSSQEKDYYNTILEGLKATDAEITVEMSDQEEFTKLVDMVYDDHAEIFWFPDAYKYAVYSTYIVMTPTYNYTGTELENRQKQLDLVTAEFTTSVPSDATDYEKCKKVFEYLIDTVDYVNNSADNQNLYSALINKQSVCAGYARATQYLLQKLGVEALYVTGSLQDQGDHAWNIVRCDGKYYQLDTTFGDRAFEDSETVANIPEELQYDYSYLCTTDEQILIKRALDNEDELPRCTSTDLNYYRLQKQFFRSWDDTVKTGLQENVQSGKTSWTCQFADADAYSQAAADFKSGYYSDLVKDYLHPTDSLKTWYLYDDASYTITCWY